MSNLTAFWAFISDMDATELVLFSILVLVGVFVLFLLFTMIVSVFTPKPTTGTISDKEFRPSRTTIIMMPVGKVTVPLPQTSLNSWHLHLTGSKIEGWIEVDEQTFNSYELSDTYPSHWRH